MTRKPALGLVLVFAGCAAHVQSSLQVDGAPFSPSSCRSGQASGFSGVELADDQGRRLRLAQNLNGSLAGVYFPAGAPIGEDLAGCITMTTQPGVVVVNGVRNVEGSALLSCRTQRHQVSGSVQFKNCH